MLLNLHKKSWMEGLTLQDYSDHCKHNETIVKEMLELAKNYNKVSTWTGNLTLVFFLDQGPKIQHFWSVQVIYFTMSYVACVYSLRLLKKRTRWPLNNWPLRTLENRLLVLLFLFLLLSFYLQILTSDLQICVEHSTSSFSLFRIL